MSWEVRVVRNRYVDSVRLMQVAQAVRTRTACGRARSWPARRRTWSGWPSSTWRPTPRPGDIVIAVDADGGADGALDAAERELASRRRRRRRARRRSARAALAGGGRPRGSTAPTSR